MFVTAVCFLFLLKLKWPKNKNIYDVIMHCSMENMQKLLCEMQVDFVFVLLKIQGRTH